MAADFRFLSRSQQKEMEIKRDTIMTSYFKEMTLGFFLSLQLMLKPPFFCQLSTDIVSLLSQINSICYSGNCQITRLLYEIFKTIKIPLHFWPFI